MEKREKRKNRNNKKKRFLYFFVISNLIPEPGVLVVEGRVSGGPSLQVVEEVRGDLVEGEGVLDVKPGLVNVHDGDLLSSTIVAQLFKKNCVMKEYDFFFLLHLRKTRGNTLKQPK